jgi:hypothetical protein
MAGLPWKTVFDSAMVNGTGASINRQNNCRVSGTIQPCGHCPAHVRSASQLVQSDETARDELSAYRND